MRINPVSDLHLEFGDEYRHNTNADVVVFAGDIGTGTRGCLFAKHNSGNAKVVYVAGNHEFYNHSFSFTRESLYKDAQKYGINFLDNRSIIIDGVRFIGTTLWTDYALDGNQPVALFRARQSLNDHRLIIENGLCFTPEMALDEHRKSLNFLVEELNKKHNGPTVVVTHHAPSEMSIAQEYKGSSINPCFASNLTRFIEVMQPDLWIHGHVHNSFDYYIGKTRVIANPRGYVPGAPNRNFNPNLIVEI